jgi:hypothetical protein
VHCPNIDKIHYPFSSLGVDFSEARFSELSKICILQVNVANGLSLSSEYSLKLVATVDGLKHRSRSNWMTEYTNCQVGASDIWFQSTCVAIQEDPDDPEAAAANPKQQESSERRQIEKSFFFSVEDVQYNREVSPMVTFPHMAGQERSPAHILTVTGAKGAWTQSNRDMAFSLYDSWRRAHILREQVSAEGMKVSCLFTNSVLFTKVSCLFILKLECCL